jgi:malate dehydrogenase (oxaloacetate-decarboxylating)(NADP+)
VKIVCSGAGAAAMACLDLLLDLGARRENIFVCDSKGVLSGAQPRWRKAAWAQDTMPPRCPK